MAELPVGTVVRLGDRQGVVVENRYDLVAPWETPVVWYGGEAYEGTLTEDLEVLGPDPAVADMEKCGAGTERCCIFLAMDGSGLRCIRFTELRDYILARSDAELMVSTRRPALAFPDCQSEG